MGDVVFLSKKVCPKCGLKIPEVQFDIIGDVKVEKIIDFEITFQYECRCGQRLRVTRGKPRPGDLK